MLKSKYNWYASASHRHHQRHRRNNLTILPKTGSVLQSVSLQQLELSRAVTDLNREMGEHTKVSDESIIVANGDVSMAVPLPEMLREVPPRSAANLSDLEGEVATATALMEEATFDDHAEHKNATLVPE